MPALSAQHLRKAFGPQVVLDDATFALARGEKVGLIGANGAGKSTLAKILAGLETPDGGTLSVRRGLTVRYLAQEPELDPDASARAVVEEALTAWREAIVAARRGDGEARAGRACPPRGPLGRTSRARRVHRPARRLGTRARGARLSRQAGRTRRRSSMRLRSGGERRRIALAQLLVASPDIAILDEPTNHLDADTAAWLRGAPRPRIPRVPSFS